MKVLRIVQDFGTECLHYGYFYGFGIPAFEKKKNTFTAWRTAANVQHTTWDFDRELPEALTYDKNHRIKSGFQNQPDEPAELRPLKVFDTGT